VGAQTRGHLTPLLQGLNTLQTQMVGKREDLGKQRQEIEELKRMLRVKYESVVKAGLPVDRLQEKINRCLIAANNVGAALETVEGGEGS
jgi:hypothetical protein